MDTAGKSPTFSTRLVGENIWSIDGPANDLMYLVTGGDRAMLVDTGMGIGNLAGVVRTLTKLPFTVVNTHGHPDHAGGNPAFSDVWLHPGDDQIMPVMCSDEYRLRDARAVLGEQALSEQGIATVLVPYKPYPVHPMHAGDVFDLGGRQFEVLEIPGHTPGSIGLLCKKERLLFSGDSIVATPVWMYLEHSLPLRTYLDALTRIAEKYDRLEAIYPGHQPTPLGHDHLLDLIACAQEILLSPGIGTLTKTFAGEGLAWVHGKGQIIYNPENLR